jgi:hypothetical protein
MSDVKFCFGQISEGPGGLCHCVDGKPHHHYVSSVWNGARWVLLSSEEGKSIIDALIADPDNIEETAKLLGQDE